MIDTTIDYNSKEFIDLCKSHKIKELYLFGSRATGTYNKDSDFDLLVEIDESNPIDKGRLLLSLYDKFEKFFNSKIDLITPDSIRNAIFEEYVGTSKQLIYDGSKT